MRARLIEFDCVDFSQLTYSNDNLVEHALLLISQELVMNPKDAAKALQLINDTVISFLGLILSREYEFTLHDCLFIVVLINIIFLSYG